MNDLVIKNGISGELNKDLEYISITQPEFSLNKPPNYWVGDFSKICADTYFNQHEIWGTGIHIIKNINIFGSGLLFKENKKIQIYETNTHPVAYENHSKGLVLNANPIQEVEEEVIILYGLGYGVYGHWLIDFLPKLYLLNQAQIDWVKYKFLLPIDVPEYAKNLLKYFGIFEEKIIYYNPSKGVKCSSLILPTLLRTNSRVSSIFKNSIDYIKNYLNTESKCDTYEKIYFSRLGLVKNDRQIINQLEVEKVMIDNGFKIMQPQNIPYADQIRIYKNVKVFSGEYGSALHNSIYASATAKVLCIRSTGEFPGFLQSGICSALKQNIGYCFASQQADKDGFLVDLRDLKKALSHINYE